MSGSGRIIIDFGAAPGATNATVAVTGQSAIVMSSLCEGWIDATAPSTPDHNPDEHSVLASYVGISCQDIVTGVGFTIHAVSSSGAVVGQV